jgi:hypothetical protein
MSNGQKNILAVFTIIISLNFNVFQRLKNHAFLIGGYDSSRDLLCTLR